MKFLSIGGALPGRAVLAACAMWAADSLAAQKPGAAVVRDMLGPTGYSTNGTRYAPPRPGMTLPSEVELRTGEGAVLDLDFGEPMGRVRLTENTRLQLVRVPGRTGGEAWKLNLRSGVMVGFKNHVAKPSQFQVKTSAGLVGVASSQYRVDARGYLVALDGLMIMAHPAADESGTIETHVLQAPPSVYFAPGYGVEKAPAVLVQEVLKQITSSLQPTPPAAGSPAPDRRRRPGTATDLFEDPSDRSRPSRRRF